MYGEGSKSLQKILGTKSPFRLTEQDDYTWTHLIILNANC